MRGNPDLGPEKARTWMLGVDVHPESLPGLKAELTYFDINYKNQIASIFGGALQQEALYADVITRNPTQAQINAVLAAYPLSGVLPVPVQYIIDARPQNRAARRWPRVLISSPAIVGNPHRSGNCARA